MAIGDFGDSRITVNKAELLASIKKNRDGHRAEFEKAQVGFRAAVIEELDRMLADAKSNKSLRLNVSLNAPQDHTKDYDRVIRMLEMSTADEVTVTESQFSHYVLDEWGWMAASKMTNSRYLG